MLTLWLSNSQDIRKLPNQDFVSLGLIRAVNPTIAGISAYAKARNFHAVVVADLSVIVVFTALMSLKDTYLDWWVGCLLACSCDWLTGRLVGEWVGWLAKSLVAGRSVECLLDA